MRIASIAFAIWLLLPVAQASNTAPSRSFTTDWLCDNGRTLRFNAHPRRPEGAAQLTYIGSRVEVAADTRSSPALVTSARMARSSGTATVTKASSRSIRCCPNRSLAG